MLTLTKDNAEQHCRTCLIRLLSKESTAEEMQDFVNLVGNQGASKLQEGTTEESKEELCINISTNVILQEMLVKYIDDEPHNSNMQGYPQSLCLCCYNKLQNFERFRKQAQESAAKLRVVFCTSGVTKVEIDCEVAETSATEQLDNGDGDVYKMFLKDALMETESVMLNNTAETALSRQMTDPDPFDATADPAKRQIKNKNTFLKGEENSDNCNNWEHPLDTESSFSETEETKNINVNTRQRTRAKTKQSKTLFTKKEETENEDEDDDGDDDNEDEEEDENEDNKKEFLDATDEESEEEEHIINNTRLRSHSKKRNEAKACKTEKASTTKKKRRTKKEMEEWRKSQTNNLMDNKAKRRNKGTKNSFKCHQCSHCFAHKITLDAHIRKVHEGSKRPFKCDRCDKSYTFIGGLYTHIKEIHEAEVRSYSCDHAGCDRIYTSFIAMQKHKRTKHCDVGHQKKYVCEQCGATFNQIGNLKYHRRSKHPTEAEQAEKEKAKERFECTICKKHFHSRYTLKYHMLQLHSNDMKYECNVCGRRMAKKFMLVQHMLVHSTDKMPCEHCGKQFIRKFELEAHIRAVHMKLKPFECQYCSECFATRKTLRHHEYIHTGEKPYVCDICGQAYRQQTCLKNHRKSHDKINSEALLAANINRTLMNTFLGSNGVTTAPTPLQQSIAPIIAGENPPATSLNEAYKGNM